jgi:hypothetical protein
VISANIHRRHLTAEQKRELIAKVLKEKPELSNRQLGEMLKADHKTVGSTRDKLEATGEIPQLKKTTGKDGKPRKHPKPKSEPKPVSATSKVAPPPDQPKPVVTAHTHAIMNAWYAAGREDRRAFIAKVGMTELYAQAPSEQKEELAATIKKMPENAPANDLAAVAASWMRANQEGRRAFVDEVGMVEIYNYASDRQRHEIADVIAPQLPLNTRPKARTAAL